MASDEPGDPSESDGTGPTFGRFAGEYGVNEMPPEFAVERRIQEQQTLASRIIETISQDYLALIGIVVVVAIFLAAAFAPTVAPYDPEESFAPMQPPNSHSSVGTSAEGAYHLLGTDSFGHDMFSRIIFGARISLLVALATVAVAFFAGTAIGLIAGFYGGWVDSVLMRYIDFQWAFPALILAVAIIAFFGSLGVLNVIVAIGVAFIDDFARLIRGEALAIREEDYITAARAVGMSNGRIMLREVLPNAVAPLIVQATLMIPLAILAEAALSFLGLGVNPTTPTWGLLLSDGRQFISQAWWISVMPGFAVMFTVLAFNMVGDALRDAFDINQGEVGER